MKIEFKNNDIQVETIKFPLLARLKKHGNVVLFTNMNSGLVLSDEDGTWEVGKFSTDWLNVTDSEYWEILPKNYKVIFTQE
jgi:hypothetical protein